MHRHGYTGKKLGRTRDQRRALIKGLATNLVTYGKIETTLPKAKELVRYIEKLITKAKQTSLNARREVLSKLYTQEAAKKLIDEIVPKIAHRSSGHVRVIKTRLRVGDCAQMATVEFVDDISDKVDKKAPVKATKKEKKDDK